MSSAQPPHSAQPRAALTRVRQAGRFARRTPPTLSCNSSPQPARAPLPKLTKKTPPLAPTPPGNRATATANRLPARSCIISSPGNELRGYYLQPKEKRLGFKAFFQPSNFLRSTIAGAILMATSLAVGTYVTGPVRAAFAAIRALVMSKALSGPA